MTLRSGSGSAAHEEAFGADVLGMLTMSLPEYRVAKGFLAQAKRAKPGVLFTNSEWARRKNQSEVMLTTTPASFAMVYSKEHGVRLVPAQAVMGFSGRDVFELNDTGLQTFFGKHIESYIGDRGLNKPKTEVLQRLQAPVPEQEKPSAHVLYLQASLSE
jgi:hypothetical protein